MRSPAGWEATDDRSASGSVPPGDWASACLRSAAKARCTRSSRPGRGTVLMPEPSSSVPAAAVAARPLSDARAMVLAASVVVEPAAPGRAVLVAVVRDSAVFTGPDASGLVFAACRSICLSS